MAGPDERRVRRPVCARIVWRSSLGDCIHGVDFCDNGGGSEYRQAPVGRAPYAEIGAVSFIRRDRTRRFVVALGSFKRCHDQRWMPTFFRITIDGRVGNNGAAKPIAVAQPQHADRKLFAPP